MQYDSDEKESATIKTTVGDLFQILNISSERHPQTIEENWESYTDWYPEADEVLRHERDEHGEDWVDGYFDLETDEQQEEWINDHEDAIAEARMEMTDEEDSANREAYMKEYRRQLEECIDEYTEEIRKGSPLVNMDSPFSIEKLDYYGSGEEALVSVSDVRKANRELANIIRAIGANEFMEEVIDNYLENEGHVKGIPPLPLEDVAALANCAVEAPPALEEDDLRHFIPELRRCRLKFLDDYFHLIGDYSDVRSDARDIEKCIRGGGYGL